MDVTPLLELRPAPRAVFDTVEAGLLTSSLKLRRKAVYAHLRDRFEALYG